MTDPFDETDPSDAEELFEAAAALMQNGESERAKEYFKQVLRMEPRLPEPYLELAVISHLEGDLELAIDEARMGLELLQKGGQWTESLPEHVVLAHAQNLLGELLVELAQQGDTPLNPELFAPIWNEAVELFGAAHKADPQNARARRNAVLYKPFADPTPETDA